MKQFSLPTLIITAIWTIAFIIALLIDGPLATWVHTSGVGSYVRHAIWWPVILKAPGDFRFNLIVVFLLVLVRQIRWKQGVLVVLAGVLSGANALIKWIVGRYRPYQAPGSIQPRPFQFEPFWHGWHGLIRLGPLSFPSGHASASFALATALIFVWPRGGRFFVLLAILTGLERIAENAHYASDVVGAMGFSMLCVLLLNSLLKEWIGPKLSGFEPIFTDTNSG